MKAIKHILTFAAALIATFFCISLTTYASVITYVGSDACSDGLTTITNSAVDEEDYALPRYMKLYQKADTEDALYFENDFEFDIPDNASKYISVSTSKYFAHSNFSDNDSISENGLYVSTAIVGELSFDGNLKAEYVPGMLAMTSADADSALKYLTSVVNEQGAAEGFIVIIADQNKTIYVEVTAENEIKSVELSKSLVAKFGEKFLIDESGNIPESEAAIDYSGFSTKDYLDYLRDDKTEFSYQTLIKIHSDCPASMCLEEWVTLYDASDSQFTVLTNAETKIPSAYGTQLDSIEYNDSVVPSLCKRIAQITKGREDNFENLYLYWDEIENILIKKQETIFEEAKTYAQGDDTDKALYLLAYAGSDAMTRTANDLYEVAVDVDYLESNGETITEYDPYVNLKFYSEYYGYSYSATNKIITISNGTKTLKIFSPTNYVDLKGNILTSEGLEEGVDAKFYYSGAMVRYSVASNYFDEDPVTFDSSSIINTYSENNTNVKNIILFFAGMVVFLGVVSVAFIVLNKKKKGNANG